MNTSVITIKNLINLFWEVGEFHLFVNGDGDEFVLGMDEYPKEIENLPIECIENPQTQPAQSPIIICVNRTDFENYSEFYSKYEDKLISTVLPF